MAIDFTKFANDVANETTKLAIKREYGSGIYQQDVERAVLNVLSRMGFPKEGGENNSDGYNICYQAFKEAFEGAYVKKEPESIHKADHIVDANKMVDTTKELLDDGSIRERPVDTTKTIEELTEKFLVLKSKVCSVEQNTREMAKILVETFRLR